MDNLKDEVRVKVYGTVKCQKGHLPKHKVLCQTITRSSR